MWFRDIYQKQHPAQYILFEIEWQLRSYSASVMESRHSIANTFNNADSWSWANIKHPIKTPGVDHLECYEIAISYAFLAQVIFSHGNVAVDDADVVRKPFW